MKGSSFKWKGFEFAPDGCLLDQVIDISGQMGVAYERSCEFYKDFHTHDRLMLIFPRDSCVMEVRLKDSKTAFSIDSSTALTVPKILEHDDEGMSSIYDTLALYPDTTLISDVAKHEGYSPAGLDPFFSECYKFKRSAWLDQLVREYFFERILSKTADSKNLEFFERQIIREVLKSILGKTKSQEKQPQKKEPTNAPAVRALKYIESNLFSKMDLDLIAKQTFQSTSTLLRHFKAATGKTPYEYIKGRRLEEALRLLKSGDYPVGQVALLVGYENFGAFSEAFKEKYKKSPSAFIK